MLSPSSAATFLLANAARLTLAVWDVSLTLINVLTPSRRAGQVIAAGHPGAGGKWPEFIPPKEGDSRSACPALNALANHGILPRDGRNISFKELNRVTGATFNFAPTFCYIVPKFSAKMLGKSYSDDTFDLEELSMHNGIEHDASFTRQDTVHQPNQAIPHVPLVKEFLESATGKAANGELQLTVEDLSRFTVKRRADAMASNAGYAMSSFHRAFGSTNTSFLLTSFGGRVCDLEHFLIEERIPEGWEPVYRGRMGFTVTSFSGTAWKVERGAKEKTE